MFRAKTVIIVGAGASSEFSAPDAPSFPIGKELVKRISDSLGFAIAPHIMTCGTGDAEIWDLICSQHPTKMQRLTEASVQIAQGVGCFNSIDKYVHTHSGSPEIATCAKWAIAKNILRAEGASVLASVVPDFGGQLLQKTWLRHLMDSLMEGRGEPTRKSFFENLSIICFNYDRCIEQYVERWMHVALNLPFEDAQEWASDLKIYRPYGSLGSLKDVTFGDTKRRSFERVSGSIRTFSEQEEKQTKLDEITEVVRSARSLVFLGFGFDELNMELLDPKGASDVKRIYATTYQTSSANTEAIREKLLRQMFKTGPHVVLEDLKSFELMDQYSRPLRTPA